MEIEIITIGDELLIGQVIDTNSAWMGQLLESEGFRVVRRTTVRDDRQDLLEAFKSAMDRTSIVLVTGGIGPTKDDITKKTLCEFFESSVHFSEEVYQNIKNIYCCKGRVMNELTRLQAMVPDLCTVIQNKAGTAPCTWFEKEKKILISMPGVPSEMKWLMTNEVLPRLKSKFQKDLYIQHQTCWVSGFSESSLAIKLADFEKELPTFIKLAYLPQPGVIRLRLSAYGKTQDVVVAAISEQKAKLRDLLGSNILVEEDKSIEELIGNILLDRHLLMGTAESCTGGKIASMITSIPGSSAYFVGGIVSYSNNIKHNVLNVSSEDLDMHGAVSKLVVEQMVKGAMSVLECDCAVATSGIAGPGGGTTEKPVGTVWIAAGIKDHVVSECFHFGMNREQNIQRSANMALLMLLHLLQESE